LIELYADGDEQLAELNRYKCNECANLCLKYKIFHLNLIHKVLNLFAFFFKENNY
jgi:hypothetical protein